MLAFPSPQMISYGAWLSLSCRGPGKQRRADLGPTAAPGKSARLGLRPLRVELAGPSGHPGVPGIRMPGSRAWQASPAAGPQRATLGTEGRAAVCSWRSGAVHASVSHAAAGPEVLIDRESSAPAIRRQTDLAFQVPKAHGTPGAPQPGGRREEAGGVVWPVASLLASLVQLWVRGAGLRRRWSHPGFC